MEGSDVYTLGCLHGIVYTVVDSFCDVYTQVFAL